MEGLKLVLDQLETCIREERYQSVETDACEVKPVPSTKHDWDSIHQSVCAFLNKQGGLVILGIKEVQKPVRRFVFTGYDETSSGNMKRLSKVFTDRDGIELDLLEYISPAVEPFITGQVAIVRVSPLPEDKRFAFYRGIGYERSLDGDGQIPSARLDIQEERRRDLEMARELMPVDNTGLKDIDLNRLNQYVQALNKGGQIETLKPSIEDARSLLDRKRFIDRKDELTTLGMLVCGDSPDRWLLSRCHLDGFVEGPVAVAEEKKTYRDNVLQLMEAGVAWTIRNIQSGVSLESGGSRVLEYPEKLVRESINNALAHRDYSITRPVQITIHPKRSIAIRNPGSLPPSLLIRHDHPSRPVRRIFANPKARNPRLVDVLKVFDKWEGRGTGMSDLTNYALRNAIEVPYYIMHSKEELSLVIESGKVLDESMEEWLALFDRLISEKTQGAALSIEQKIVLSYIIKSERANRLERYTIALTNDNNHFGAIAELERWGLIKKHPECDELHRVFIATEELVEEDVSPDLKTLFGSTYTGLDPFYQAILRTVFLADRYSTVGGLNAKQIYRLLRPRMMDEVRRVGEDEFYRAVRRRVQNLAPPKAQGRERDLQAWVISSDKLLKVKGPVNRPVFALNSAAAKTLFG